MINQKQIRELFLYNQHTGILRWRKKYGTAKKGDEAGYIQKDGYGYVGINKKKYFTHRIIWCGVYGYFPENDIDHIDRIRHHNWLSNLREVSKQCNSRNTGNFKNNTSGVKGVHLVKETNKWKAVITLNNKKKYLGIYDQFHDAVIARYKAEEELNWNSCDQESPACKYLRENGLILDRVNEPYI